jgi:DNA-binding MarR family transcriptional regulator
MEQKKRLDKATKELAALLENYFDSLSPAEREAKSAAFRQAAARIGTRAKSRSL